MRPVLILNPADDDAFASLAHTAIGSNPADSEALQEEMRRTYPNAAVHVRELAGEPNVTWYVYRDGRWVRPRKER